MDIMEVISSSENTFIKKVSKLKDKKFRCEYGEFLLEGYRLIKDVLASGIVSNLQIIAAESRYEEYKNEFDCLTVVSDKIFEKLSDTVNSQGIAAVSPLPKLKSVVQSEYCLYLDRVRDPGNMGTIIRTAAACGFKDIILDNCVDVFNPKTIRSSMSAYLYCNFIEGIDAETLKENGYIIICGDMKGANITEFKYNDRHNTCLVIGNEANGISNSLMLQADYTVALPMSAGVESLNASVSAGVLMYYLKYFV